jgi:aldose sugar dehydrogenase
MNLLNSALALFVFMMILLIPNLSSAQVFPEYKIEVQTVAENLEVPWAIAFAPDGRMFVTERTGKVRVIEDGILQSEPMLTLNVGRVEGGLLGIALDPDFETNSYVYLYYTYSEFLSTYNRVSKFSESNNKLHDEVILIDKIPGAAVHDGGRIKFGPDGKLYVTTGDAANAMLSQDLNSLAGKILRINPDGTIPEDNPFSNSLVYSYGHRNPQGLDWDPTSGSLVISEHGPSGDRGFAHDEFNLIMAGQNYGWPYVVGDEFDPKFTSPLFHTGNVAWAPSGAVFYNQDKIPSLQGKFLVANLRGTHIHVFDFDTEKNVLASEGHILDASFGRLRDVAVGNDGYLYVLTSNRDGRGSPTTNDDRILRIVSLESQIGSQIKQQIDPHRPSCPQNLEVVIKATDGSPACVKPDTKIKLIERGWAKND